MCSPNRFLAFLVATSAGVYAQAAGRRAGTGHDSRRTSVHTGRGSTRRRPRPGLCPRHRDARRHLRVPQRTSGHLLRHRRARRYRRPRIRPHRRLEAHPARGDLHRARISGLLRSWRRATAGVPVLHSAALALPVGVEGRVRRGRRAASGIRAGNPRGVLRLVAECRDGRVFVRVAQGRGWQRCSVRSTDSGTARPTPTIASPRVSPCGRR